MLIKTIALYIAGTLDILLGAFVFTKNIKNHRNIGFLLFSLSIGIWSIAVANYLLAASEKIALLWDNVFPLALTLISTSFYHFSLSFSCKDLHKKIKSLFWLYSINLLVIPGYFIPKFYIKSIVFYSWGKASILGIGYHLCSLVYLILIVLSFINLFTAFNNKENTARDRQIGRFVFIGLLTAFIFGSIFNWLFVLINYYKLIWVGPYSLFIVIGTTAYAITRHRLMDIRVAVNRLAAYLILFIFYPIIIFVCIIIYSNFFLFGFNISTIVFLILLIMTASIAFHPLRLHLQTTPDRFLFRKKYEYEQMLKYLSEACRSVVNLESLLKQFANKITTTLKPKGIQIYLSNKHNYLKIMVIK